jgi:hypothetical protein
VDETWSKKILGTLLGMMIAFTAYEMIQSFAFRSGGERCNAQRCGWIEDELGEHITEDVRLQLQIDVVEEQIRELTDLCIRGATYHDGDLHAPHGGE